MIIYLCSINVATTNNLFYVTPANIADRFVFWRSACLCSFNGKDKDARAHQRILQSPVSG